MKWMLVVMIFGTQAVKTDLIFDTLDACLAAEERMRAEQVSKYNRDASRTRHSSCAASGWRTERPASRTPGRRPNWTRDQSTDTCRPAFHNTG